ncbi:MAG: 30S ribosomal protein S20 [Planctomycetes bacterium]|jgi:small subunit ribosomal protein S20|nr:30S ribosomal protein S20 [Planctomycetota bacterium]MCC7063288.1 30S ribosomal protein S20 [Planctomycetota bacterium]
MAHSKQALKRARQGERNRVANKAKLTRVKSALKALMAVVAAGDATKAKAMLPALCKTIDKAAQTHVLHKNTAARKKSLVARAVGSMK